MIIITKSPSSKLLLHYVPRIFPDTYESWFTSGGERSERRINTGTQSGLHRWSALCCTECYKNFLTATGRDVGADSAERKQPPGERREKQPLITGNRPFTSSLFLLQTSSALFHSFLFPFFVICLWLKSLNDHQHDKGCNRRTREAGAFSLCNVCSSAGVCDRGASEADK